MSKTKLVEGKTIAQAFPARTDSNGTTWYAAGAGRMDGWTANPEYADPSYFDPTTEGETTTVTELQEGPVYARYSEFSRYPLPPFPETVNVDMDGYKRYKLPHPETGRPTAYTRATTIASVIADYYTLNRWKQRMVAVNIMTLLKQAEQGHAYAIEAMEKLGKLVVESPDEKNLGRYLDELDNELGGADARELGGAVHDWIAELDMGRVLIHQIPEMFHPYVRAYQDSLARAGLIAIPEYTERIVLNQKGAETIAGRLDGIAYCVETDELVVIDRKTSKTLDFGVLEYGCQLAVYAYADLMLLPDRSGWEPMPEVSGDFTYVIHVPSDQPEKSQVVPMKLWPGGEAMVTAFDVRDKRRNDKANFLGGTYPLPSERSLQYVQARQALQNVRDLEHAQKIMAEYEAVWDDDLSQFGAQCFGLLSEENEK